MKISLIITFIALALTLSSNSFAQGKVCKDNKLDKITICQAKKDNANPGKVKFVNKCVAFSALYSKLSNHPLTSVGECGSSNNLTDGVVYACNAGIKHVAAAQVCYQRSNPSVSCNPNPSCDSSTESCDCVCSGTNGGENNVDYVKFNGRNFSEYEDLSNISDENFWSNTLLTRNSLDQGHSSSIDNEGFVVATHNPESFVLKDQSLSFQLGSELFGSEYFVDLCWKNTNEDNVGTFDINSLYSYKNKDLFGDSYVSSADIHTKTDVVCTDSDYNSFSQFEETYFPFPSQMSEMTPYIESVEDVSFCRVRHYFKENNVAFRPWEVSAIDISTKLEVKLSDDTVVDNDDSVRICHIVTVGAPVEGSGNGNGNNSNVETVTCQLEFATSDDYKRFVLHHSPSVSSYNPHHNSDYRLINGNNCSGIVGTPSACYDLINQAEGFTHDVYINGQNELIKALNLRLNN